jgi:NADPH:quinone reductase-like Zn-dependent oxidoreductase
MIRINTLSNRHLNLWTNNFGLLTKTADKNNPYLCGINLVMDKKVVFITGASSGIGRATALLLAKHNYTVYGAARRIDRLMELESQGIKPLVMDVTNDTEGIFQGRRKRLIFYATFATIKIRYCFRLLFKG